MLVHDLSTQVSAAAKNEPLLDYRDTRLASRLADDDMIIDVDETDFAVEGENVRQEEEPHSQTPAVGDGDRNEGGPGPADGESVEQGRCITSLIPGLPKDVAESCVARVPWVHQPKLTTVCKAWHSYMDSHIGYEVRARQQTSEGLLVVLSVPVRLGPLRLTVFDATEAKNLEWHKPLAVFNNPGKWSGFLRGFRCAVVGPDLFIVGGRHDGMQYATGRTVRRFNFLTRRWTEAAPMHAARRDFACAVIEDRIYVAGGTVSSKVFPQGNGALKGLSSAEVYDHDHDQWHDLPQLGKTRVGCLGVALENQFYVIGGGINNGSVQFELDRSAEVFDTSKFRWRTIEDMWRSEVQLPRAVAGFDRSLFAVDSDDRMLKSYDEEANRWKAVMAMPFGKPVLPGRQVHAERQQAMGGVPGDQLIDIPNQGLFWMGPCSYLSRAHHLLGIPGRGCKRGCSRIVAGVEDEEPSPFSSAAAESGSTLPGKNGMPGGDSVRFKSLGKRSCLVTGSGFVYI